MKKSLLFLMSFSVALSVSAQQPSTAPAVSPSIQVSTAVQTPQSNIDLLKQSLQTSSNVMGTASSIEVPPPAPMPVSQPPAASSTTLDMPLEMGGTVQSVQTTVAAPAKQLSPAAAKRVQQAKEKRAQAAQAKPTALEKDIEKSNALLPASQQQASSSEETEELSPEEAAAEAELEYAVKMLEKSKEALQTAGRSIPPSAAQNRPKTVPAPNKKFDPNAYRPGVTWVLSKSTHFDIYTQKRSTGISSSNMSMTFESAYQTLRRFIPWMMSGRVRVFVYQDHQSYLRYEPNAKAWTRAMAYPTRGEIVVYDEPGKTQELKEVFTHELTHIFTQQFFDSHKTGRIMTPTWLDEGLAVLLEDQAYNGLKGGPWNNDFKTLNFQRDPSTEVASFGSSSMFGSAKKLTAKKPGKPLYLVPFAEFMEEGSLNAAEGRGKTQDWYFQAYLMVRFLLNPAGGASPSNRMQFEQFTRLLSEGEAVRNPSTGFLVKDSRGKTVYQPYSVEKALGRAYRYNSIANFEDNFWRWADK
ncbi:hypothetical protein [Candidatus Avelusimicrobium gallicola]|uniref:Uncharacterized protein n=1 Tax=Candidatus Avelusimicrobium gallicola TaxID=2562704 RepID=A0A1Y4DKZ8_9BACT|nr:hypothetical protein [Elusimicrobium sp. An273]OUO56970.1 hypothetical protein B5F75_03745 [Elusimicrobium sp. An273]